MCRDTSMTTQSASFAAIIFPLALVFPFWGGDGLCGEMTH